MRKLNAVVCLSLSVLTVALFAGCGGKSASPTNAASSDPGTSPNPNASPTPTPSASPTPTPPGTPPSNAQVISGIQKLTGWQTCVNACSGTATAVISMTQGIATPSLSGSSAEFSLLTGTSPFGGAMWFEALGAHNSATHFLYDLNYYVDNPSVAQALEFYVTQSAGGKRYNFGAQCDLAGGKNWRMWDNIGNKWINSAATCAAPAAKTWTHLVFEFEHQPGGTVTFTAVTVNGKREVVNLASQPTPDTNSGLDVAYQSDANIAGAPFSVWLDKVSVTYW
ncbi:MAG TPA: hypothetical protein VFB76_10835 [Candidatus Angelobacter sp.]|nr:hypothetical protein [Candidatus Angelobacter sp.]